MKGIYCDLCGKSIEIEQRYIIGCFKNDPKRGYPRKVNLRIQACGICFNELVNTLALCKSITDLEKERKDIN